MNKKDPGIIYESVILKSFFFERGKDIPTKDSQFSVDFSSHKFFNKDATALQYELSAIIAPSDDTFKLELTVIGSFRKEGEGMDLKKFAEVSAPAHLFPFIRENVATLTLKAGLPPVLLPPMNLRKMVDESKHKKSP